MGGDQTLFAEVSQLFIEDCPARLAAIRAAVDDGDAERIRETAHALKGAAGSLSATGLYEATASLERLAAEGQLMAYRHDGFWQCMDTYRDQQQLQQLWASGQAAWKTW